MAIQFQGNAGVVAEVEANSRAIRTMVRGIDPGALGTYRISAVTGLMAAGLAAGAEVFQFRWTDATRLCAVERIAFDGLSSVTAFAAGVATLQAFKATSWSADGSGGTAITPAASMQKQRTTMGNSLVGSARISSTAALTAGTKTLDTQAFGQAVGGLTATAGAGLPPQNIMDVMAMGYPLILVANEGFVIKATVPATGTWTGGVTIHWTEVTAY
jgi:hypothetical protein